MNCELKRPNWNRGWRKSTRPWQDHQRLDGVGGAEEPAGERAEEGDVGTDFHCGQPSCG